MEFTVILLKMKISTDGRKGSLSFAQMLSKDSKDNLDVSVYTIDQAEL